MSAKPVGRALFLAAAIILLILALPAVLASNGEPPAGDGQPPMPPTGDPPTEILHSHQHQESGAPTMLAPPKPKDVYLFLPLLSRPNTCDLNEEEEAIATLATSHPDQERLTMSCHPILAQVARAHALDMATRDYYSETNPEGFGPNARVEQAGYMLPDTYAQEPDANNIESIIVGYDTPELAWNSWLDGAGHEEHVLGESNFKDQTNYGVGYAFSADSQWKHYWVFTTAPPPAG